jgi:hypothetical protein
MSEICFIYLNATFLLYAMELCIDGQHFVPSATRKARSTDEAPTRIKRN